jgi:hypothetical protein
MRLNIYYVFYIQCYRRHVSAGIPVIFRVMSLQEHKGTNVLDCVTIIP